MANPLPKTLAFRHTFVSSVVKENTVTLFGEIGAEFQLGTDYDAEILYKVSSSELSNLFNYYNGGLLNSQVVLPNGSVGSADLTSMLSVNAEVTEVSIKPYHYGYMEGERSRLTPQDSKQDGGQYYLGDVVLFNPDPLGDVSCWTCIRTTSSPAAPIPLRGTVTPGQINRDAVPGSTYQFSGFYGTDRNSQNYITGVKPAYYTVPGSTSTNVTLPNPLAKLVYNSEYWKESAIARSYNSAAIYYAGELVTFSGGVYECISTQGDKVTPSLFRNVTPGTPQETIKLSTSLDARNGAFGADFGGQRYIQNVPPSGGVHSEQYWKPGSFRRLPTTVYANLNWTNFEVNGKINQYDANISGGNGAQTIPAFTDDNGSKVVTLRKIYDDNEKGFIMDVATSILARIPAAAIKAQVIGERPAPDSSLAEMVLAGPHWTYPDNYAPAVQGVFEEAVYRDMLQVSGVPTTITDFIVSTGSEGYFQDGSTGRPNVDLVQKIDGKSILATNPINCTFNLNNRVYARCGISRVFVDKSKPSYVLDTNAYATGDVVTFAFPNQESMFFIQPTAVVNAVDETNGKILSVTVTNPGDGIRGLGPVSCNGNVLSYLIPYAKVTSLMSAFLPIDTKVDHWDFTDGNLVSITQGSGSGATGMAVVTAAANNPPLTTEYSGTLSISFDKVRFPAVEYGSKYLGPPNNLYKQDLVMITQPGTSARIPAVVTQVDTNGGIRNVKLLKQGCGYLQAPIIQLGRPPLNPLDRALACDPVSGATGGVIINDSQLLGVTLSGRYTLKTSSGDTVLPLGYVSGIGSTYGQINPYVGINYVDVVYGGLGFRSGELLDVVGSVTPAVFNVQDESAGGTFLTVPGGGIDNVYVSIVNGGNGYKQDQYVVLDGPTSGVELLGQVTRLGGNATSLFFQDSDLCGINFQPGNYFTLSGNVNQDDQSVGDELVGRITKVGAYGQLYDDSQITRGPTSLAYSNLQSGVKAIIGTSGLTGTTFNVRDLLTGIPLYNQVESIRITNSGAIYSGTSNPTITIDPPTATGNGVSGFVVTEATAIAVLGLNGLGVTGAKGANFVSGDFVYVNQVEGVNSGLPAVPAKAVVLQVDDVGAIQALGVENTGEDFDLSKPFFYTTTGDGTAPGGSTGGTTFNAMFQSYFTIIRVEMLKHGKGYLTKPTVTISGTSRGVPQLCDAIVQRAGSGGLFQLTSFDPTSSPIGFTVKLLNRGVGYVEGDVLEFWGPLLADDGYVQGHGVLALVDRTVGGNILAADFTVIGSVQGTLYKPGPYVYNLGSPSIFSPFTNGIFPLRFRVLTVGDPTSISRISILKSRGAYSRQTQFTHKKLATVSVDQVDSFGKILSLKYDNPGYGYRGIPLVKPRRDSAGVAALFSVPYMGVSRIENGYYANSFNISSVKITSPVALLPATAYATIPGDLYPISVDLFKNPNILDTLETIKPGSTTGYAQGKAIMSIQNVFVKHPGKSLGNLLSTNHGQTGAQDLEINISPPDLTPEKGGIQAKAFVQSSGWDQTFQRILAVTVPNDGHGAGYLKPPIITVTLADGNISDNMPILVAQMAVTGVYVTSRGLGFGNPPGAKIEDSDLTPGLHATVTSTTLKKTITQFDVTSPGAQYIEVPSVRVISEGTDQKGYIRTAITDIQVSNPGAGFKVGDVLEFGHFGTTGLTLTYAGATGVTYLFNSPPPSDKIYLKGSYGGVTFQSTECAQACVSEVDEIGGIVSVKINYRPYEPSKDKYGIDTRVLSKNSILYGGLGYGYPSYYEPNSGETYMMETLPRVIGFYRPDRFVAAGYFNPGLTLSSSSTLPWIDPTNGTIKKGATFTNVAGDQQDYLFKLGLDTSGTTSLSDLYTSNAIRLPKIETRLGIRKFDVWNSKEGKNHVNDAQILVETPPQSQQARYTAIRDPATNTVTTYAHQSGGLGYTSVPRILITGGGGDGANATPNMGIGEVKILNGGTGYKVGDVVDFPLPSGGGAAASGVVTVVDGGVLSTGKFAELDFANCNIATAGYNPATATLTGGGATGTPVLFSKGYGYDVGDEVSALPTTLISSQDPALFFNDTSTSNFVPMFVSKIVNDVAVVDVEHSYMFTWGNITSAGNFNQPLGYVFGVRPRFGREGKDAYAIVMVNAIMTKRDELIILYDENGNLVSAGSNLGAYSYENYTEFGRRTGLVTATNPTLPFAQLGQYENPGNISGVGLGAIPSFRFMGWSDGSTEPATRYEYPWWYNIAQLSFPDYFEVKRTPATFRVDSIDDQANGYAAGTILTSGSLGYFDSRYTLTSTSKGEITYVNVLHKGSGYTAVPETSAIMVNSLDGTPSGTGARFYATLTLVSLLATTVGNLYFSAPQVYIDPPLFRSLSPQLYARSAEILYQNSSNFDWISADPAIEVISNGEGYVWSGIYKLVVDTTVGGMHQTGNASFSIDSLIMFGGSQNLLDQGKLTSGVNDKTTRYKIKDSGLFQSPTPATKSLLQESIYIVRGSNYRPNEIYKLIPYGSTPSLTTSIKKGVAAVIKILKVTDYLNNDGTQIFGSGNNDFIGILDEGRVINDEDVGGYGTGYLEIPQINIVGGPQGVEMAPSLGLTNVDFVQGNRGTNYTIGDEIWAEAPEFGAVVIGKVSKVFSDTVGGVTTNGIIGGINLYIPYKEGLRSLPKLSVVRKGAFVANSVDAVITPVLGISKAAITSNTDGFVGDAFVRVDFPTGSGYVVQPKQGTIDPKYVFMVDQVEVNSSGNSSAPVLYEKAPVVKFDIPPFINTYSGWNGVYFAPGDAFEIVIQYTIAKAVAFQVDPDITLPSKYIEADSITIGGVTIPLRKPGSATSQGREISQNRVIYRYLVKFQAV